MGRSYRYVLWRRLKHNDNVCTVGLLLANTICECYSHLMQPCKISLLNAYSHVHDVYDTVVAVPCSFVTVLQHVVTYQWLLCFVIWYVCAQFSCSYHVLNFSSGLFLFVRHSAFPMLIPPISRTPALLALLAVLCCIHDCDLGTYRLFLVCNPYVSLLVTAGNTSSYNPIRQRKSRE